MINHKLFVGKWSDYYVQIALCVGEKWPPECLQFIAVCALQVLLAIGWVHDFPTQEPFWTFYGGHTEHFSSVSFELDYLCDLNASAALNFRITEVTRFPELQPSQLQELQIFVVLAKEELILATQEAFTNNSRSHRDPEVLSVHVLVRGVKQKLVGLHLGLDDCRFAIQWESWAYFAPKLRIFIRQDFEEDRVPGRGLYERAAQIRSVGTIWESVLLVIWFHDVHEGKQMNLSVRGALKDHPGWLKVLLVNVQADNSIVRHLRDTEVNWSRRSLSISVKIVLIVLF